MVHRYRRSSLLANVFIVLNLISDKNIYLANGPMFTATSAEQTVNAIATSLKEREVNYSAVRRTELPNSSGIASRTP
ncbi:MAG: hypothetical protein HWQ23_20440 [Nostoc sp. JL33]|uniref:hypothetical protein n=1 Tax=Nostoc sp. JL33 TaxID=2815396 RepID=UPI0025D309CB|nr:hypothetical protein [Nostoc sp. JL33]MBN3872558.1 hypothetical protein [Nostoc sp. JL33]